MMKFHVCILFGLVHQSSSMESGLRPTVAQKRAIIQVESGLLEDLTDFKKTIAKEGKSSENVIRYVDVDNPAKGELMERYRQASDRDEKKRIKDEWSKVHQKVTAVKFPSERKGHFLELYGRTKVTIGKLTNVIKERENIILFSNDGDDGKFEGNSGSLEPHPLSEGIENLLSLPLYATYANGDPYKNQGDVVYKDGYPRWVNDVFRALDDLNDQIDALLKVKE